MSDQHDAFDGKRFSGHLSLSRRRFLQSLAAAGLAVSVAGPVSALASILEQKDYTRFTSSHFGSFTVQVKDGKIVSVKAFARDPDPTPMLQAIPDWVYSDTRVLYPMVRKGFLEKGVKSDRTKRGAEPFVRVSWEQALDLVADELKRVKSTYGNEAIFGGPNGWRQAGRFHDCQVLLKRFLAGFGGYTGDKGGYSWGASKSMLPHVVGDQNARTGNLTTYKSIAENTKLLVLWGTTPLKNGQIMRCGGGAHTTRGYFDDIRKAGIEVVVINPVADEEVDFFKAEWVQPHPNTDTAMMLGMMHTLHQEGLYDKAFIDKYTVGFRKFENYLLGKSDNQPKTAEWAAEICEVDAASIRDLARRMAKTRSFIMMGPAMQRSDHGGYVYWMQITLSAMLGQIGLPGGGFGYGYGYYTGFGQPRSGVAVPGTGTGKNPVKTKIPTARVTDMLLNPGKTIDWNGKKVAYPDIKLIYWAGGNAIVHHQDINNMVKAWQRPETIIYHEPWWTASAKFADIVLPATTPLERNDIGRRTGADNYIVAMQQAILPVGESRNDYDILTALAGKLGFADKFTEGRDEMEWLRHMYAGAQEQAEKKELDMPDFDSFWEKGFIEFPEENVDNILYGEFRENPNRNPLGTPSGRIEIFSPVIARYRYVDSPPYPQWIEPYEWLGSDEAEKYTLHLLSSHPPYRLHSQLNQTNLREKYTVKGREPVWMNPADAKERGIEDEDLVRVFNGRGQVLAGAKVTDRIRQGVIRMDEGAWYDPAEPGKPGTLCKYGCNNVLTADVGSSKVGQGSTVKTTLAEVEKYSGAVPKVTAFEPPKIISS